MKTLIIITTMALISVNITAQEQESLQRTGRNKNTNRDVVQRNLKTGEESQSKIQSRTGNISQYDIQKIRDRRQLQKMERIELKRNRALQARQRGVETSSEARARALEIRKRRQQRIESQREFAGQGLSRHTSTGRVR